jgi:hypothetical protein
MSPTIATIQQSIDRELIRITELSGSLAVVLTTTTRSSFNHIIADIDAAAVAEPEHAADFTEIRETVIVMRDYNPFKVVANDNG